jgi:hypothetical protein
VLKFTWEFSLNDMNKIYRPDVSNLHQPLLLSASENYGRLDGLNVRRMSDGWQPLNFDFYINPKKSQRRPDITNTLPCLAFRRELRDLIFPVDSPDVELLPILASGDEWLIVNCLSSIKSFDEGRSVVHRDPGGTIFMIKRLVVPTSSINASIFTVNGSNRSSTYVLDPFVDRIKALEVEGLSFTVIGEIV